MGSMDDKPSPSFQSGQKIDRDEQFATVPEDFKAFIETIEKEVLHKALSDNQFHQRRTAESLGLSYHQLRGYLKKYHLTEKKRPSSVCEQI